MLKNIFKYRNVRKKIYILIILLVISLITNLSTASEKFDPKADETLKAMSDYLGSLSSFTMKSNIDSEIIDLKGQKIQLSSSANLAIQRPGKLNVKRQGSLANFELYFDSKVLTIFSKDRNSYYQLSEPGNIDKVLDTMRNSLDLDAPGADLLYKDSYSGLMANIVSSDYLGTGYVNGIECHHLTFREDQIDWQLWISVGDKPLPMKYIITTKWITSAPQHSVRFDGWNTQADIKAERFIFSAPKNAKKLETLAVNEIGEPIIEDSK